MNTTLTPEPTAGLTFPPMPGSKTLSVKNIPCAIWQRARQNAIASNLSFGEYVVKLLGTSGPFPLPLVSAWDQLLGTDSPNPTIGKELP